MLQNVTYVTLVEIQKALKAYSNISTLDSDYIT